MADVTGRTSEKEFDGLAGGSSFPYAAQSLRIEDSVEVGCAGLPFGFEHWSFVLGECFAIAKRVEVEAMQHLRKKENQNDSSKDIQSERTKRR
jgi:hypothetical protein